uniref:Uncoordinated 79, isoform E n=1 Tax=Drosophila melanogaster TaxID=7227 RepID=A0A0B4LID2_DROME|nr:uncoordinated 79, isoform E [Drosophila melanogaster]AHN57402.1 uncoordinated 79, isoform E [Drosophila melanogaster]|eukprot:NP_001287403.1 uncoordinated 79, isoform E [Drosophila melanogaster]
MTGSFKVQLINMGTRAAAFQAKLRALHEYHVRLLHNVLPAPSGVDIANNIKYFSQTLLTVLKDVRTSPHELIRDPLEDPTRMSAYPNLEYGNLYNALTMLIDVAPCIQYGQIVFGKALLQCLSCILPFLDKDLIDNLPYLVSSTISVLPPALHQCIINALCYYILPFTITRRSSDEQECQACQSVSSVIMMVLQYSNNPAHHCQLLECLMTLKHNVVKDILCVVAYGTAVSRTSAAKLLFYYWPAFNANLFDRKVLLSKLTNDLVPFTCQREHCPNSGNAEAAKVCYDHSISIAYAPDCPPPLYLCIECANEIHREHGSLEFGDILHPMQQVSMVCENKNCRSNEKSAFSICFSTECASFNGNHPIRYCSQCHSNRHNSRRGGDHVVHRSLQPAWQMDPEMQMHMVESVVSLLREAKPLNFEPGKESSSSESKKNGSGITADNISLEERQRLGRYGIWLLVGRCTPTADTPVEVLGRILSMLFHWFHVTAYSYDAAGQVESTIEKLKVDHVCNWLKDICRIHYNVFISCLLPHPPEYARVGGHWETLASRTSHLKEGLQRLICLVPYEVITSEIWDYVMPHWMEAITNDVAEKELNELKIVLSKILDPEMSPLGFDAKTMYNFVAIRFEKTTAKVQQQALHWLQILTKLEILIPLVQLFAMFGDGVRIMKYGIQHELMREKDAQSQSLAKAPKTPCKESKETKADMANPPRRSSISPVVEDDSGNTSAISDDEAPTNRHTEFSTDAEHNLTCCILMLDILLKQMELQDVEQHMGIHTSVCENVSRLIKCMVTAARVGLSSHVCALKVAECAYCEASIMWHQLATKLVQFMAPLNPVRPPDVPIEDIIEEEKSSRKSPPESDKEKTRDRDVSLSMAPLPIPLGPLGGFAGPVPVAVPQPEPHSVGGVLVHMPHVCSNNENGHSVDSNELRKVHATDEIMTATVETVSEQLDLASILPTDRAIARSITLSDADVGSANVSVTKASVMGENGANGGGACGGGENGSGSEEDEEEEDSDDFWHTSVGKFKFTLDTLPQPLQYIHQLLTEIPTIKKPEILYYVLQCLNTMALHGDALAKAAREQRGFFIWCQENLLIKNLWELCNAEHSHICQVGVPLLLHCITLPLGSDVFWRVVQEAFHDTDWRVRFTAVERVTVITRFMDSTPLRSEVGLQTALATAFCHLIASMDDINVYVAQRATLYIGTIHDTAIRSLLFCLESQFDLFIVDRPVVLQSVYQLHNSLSDRKMLGWEFFLNRFDTLFVEAQINLEKCGDISYLRDLRNSDNGSEALSAKIQKAREALSQSDTSGGMAKTLSASFGTKWPYKRTMSAPASMAPRQDSKFVPEKEKIYSRQVSAPILKRKTSRFGLDGHIHSLGGLNDDNLIGLLSRITELEESDRETIHLLVFMLMQFMSRTDQAYPSEEKPMTKTQNIVLKHLFLLLGHNQIDKTFHTTPESLRVSAVFNAFLANLPQVLDQNHLIGGLILPSVMQIILYAPNPTSTSGESYQNIVFNYSLWHLEQYPRRNWLFTLLVVLYKYSYTQPPLSGYVIAGIRLIMNSLRGHFHQCRRIPTTTILDIQGVGGAARSRDVSQPSLGTDPDDKEASPPASPMFPSEGTSAASKSKGNVAFTPKLQHAFRKYNDSSLDADETESELVAIPESDLSDSTLHGSSAPGSFDDTIHFEDVMPRNRRALEYTEEKSTKSHKSMITTKVGDTYTTKIKATTTSETLVTTHTRHSLQEGVRMIVTPLVGAETTETAIVSPPVDVHRAVTVRNKSLENAAASTSKMFAAIATNHLKALGALQDMPAAVERKAASSSGSGSRSANGSGNGSGGSAPAAIQASSSAAASKPIGRHKTIVECSAGNSSSSADDSRQKKSQTKSLRRTDKNYGSPDSPLSKMSVMPNPRDEMDESMQSLPPPKSIAALEIPTPERLLPIGTQDTVATLVERVRDGLNLPDISHLKQDSLDVSESTKDDVTPSSRTNSPRRLIKQVALESPPNPNAQLPSQPSADLHTSILKNVQQDLKQNAPEGNGLTTSNSIKRPRQKLAPFNVDSNAIPDIRSRFAGSWPPPPFQPVDPEPDDDDEIGAEASNGHGIHSTPHAPRGSSRRVGDYTIVERCSDCGAHIEEYTDEEIGIFIVILGTFIHREPAMAAPFLPEILTMTSRICLSSTHAWQGENGPPLASSAQAVACQFFRCVLHQLAPNGIFLQVFQTQMKMKIRHHHFRSIAKALQDFQDLNSTSPIYMVCESLTSKKSLPIEQLPVIFRNMAEYLNLQCVPTEAGVGLAVWSQAMQAMESLLRQVIVIMPSLTNAEYMLDIMAATLRLNCVPKTLLDPYSKIMAYCVQHTNLEYQTLYELCTLNIRSFSKDRDKNLLCRQMIFEFVQALKFKSNIPDHNLLTIIGFVLLDAGGTLPPGAAPGLPDAAPMMTTNSADCLRQYINDVIDFLADFHTLSKIKNFKNGQTSSGLGEDTLGGVLKGAVAQYLALEMSRGNSRDNKAVSRYLPWLNNAPSSLQQGPKEFTECVGHMRLLSWLLLGSLTHMALMQRRQETHSIPTPLPQQNSQGTGPAASVHYQHQGVTYSQPVPQEASCHIADHIQVIFAGFAEQSKTSVLHMSSLFHAFTLCQLWTVYLEQMAHNTNSNAEGSTLGVLFEFWAKVTPCILQLVSHAKPTVNKDQPQTPLDFQTQSANSKLSEMVNLHFLSLLEALKDTNSTVLGKLLPMWSPVLSSQTQLSDTLHVRLQNVRDYAPDYEEQQTYKSEALLKWLQRLQFKMGQIELQASTATQFYSI